MTVYRSIIPRQHPRLWPVFLAFGLIAASLATTGFLRFLTSPPVGNSIFPGIIVKPSDPTVVFQTKHATVWVTGLVGLTAPPDVAAQDVGRSDGFCNAVKDHPEGVNSSIELAGNLPALSNYHWQIDLRPDGTVDYDNIQPDDKAKEYFSALSKHLACE